MTRDRIQHLLFADFVAKILLRGGGETQGQRIVRKVRAYSGGYARIQAVPRVAAEEGLSQGSVIRLYNENV